jgi:hypothetical protein
MRLIPYLKALIVGVVCIWAVVLAVVYFYWMGIPATASAPHVDIAPRRMPSTQVIEIVPMQSELSIYDTARFKIRNSNFLPNGNWVLAVFSAQGEKSLSDTSPIPVNDKHRKARGSQLKQIKGMLGSAAEIWFIQTDTVDGRTLNDAFVEGCGPVCFDRYFALPQEWNYESRSTWVERIVIGDSAYKPSDHRVPAAVAIIDPDGVIHDYWIGVDHGIGQDRSLDAWAAAVRKYIANSK